MAWITDLAGKAENLLNKLDSEAATLLTEERKAKAAKELSGILNRKHSYSEASGHYHLPSSSSVPGNLNSIKRSNNNPIDRPASSASNRQYNASSIPGYYPQDSNSNVSGGNSPAPSQSSHSRQSSNGSFVGKNIDYSDSQANSGFTALNLERGNEENSSSQNSDSSSHMYVKVDPSVLTISPPLSTASDESGNHGVMSRTSEAELLKKELNSLNQEMTLLLSRAKQAEKEVNVIRSAQATGNSQHQATERLLREVQQRELDLEETLSAKDSQIAVLRVRLQERDTQCTEESKRIEELRKENMSLCEGASASSGLHSQALQNAQEKIGELQSTLEREKANHHNTLTTNATRINQLEGEQKELMNTLRELQRRVSSEEEKKTSLHNSNCSLKAEMNHLRQEFDQYKVKAAGILQSKDEIIVQLKRGRTDGDSHGSELLSSELNQARSELDLCKDELARANESAGKLRAEIGELERINEVDSTNHMDRLGDLQEELTVSMQNKTELEHENKQIRSELRYAHEELSRLKVLHTSQVGERETEIEKLRKQICLKNNSNSSSYELERKIKGLTETIIEKQNKIEQLSTSLQANSMQMNRLQSLYDDSQAMLNRDKGHQSYSMDDVRQRVPLMLTESPFDTGVTRRVKRVYSTVDRISLGIGYLLRRNPIARIIVLMYMLLLHLWVMVVLLTYTPEIHTGMHFDGSDGRGGQQQPPMPI